MRRVLYLVLAVLLAVGPVGCKALMDMKRDSDQKVMELTQQLREVEAELQRPGLTETQSTRLQLSKAQIENAIESETQKNQAISKEIQSQYAGWSDLIGRGLGAILGGGSVLGLLATRREQ